MGDERCKNFAATEKLFDFACPGPHPQLQLRTHIGRLGDGGRHDEDHHRLHRKIDLQEGQRLPGRGSRKDLKAPHGAERGAERDEGNRRQTTGRTEAQGGP